MTSTRQEKVSDLVQEEIARLLQYDVRDKRLGFVTVTGVRMSTDLKHARVFVSMLSEGQARDEAMGALTSARRYIRRELGRHLRLRYTPDIVFELDTSVEYGARIEQLLESVRGDEPDDA